MSQNQVINVDMGHSNTTTNNNKPAIAHKLEQESQEFLKKKQELTSEKLDRNHAIADERRQKVLDQRVERAEELEKGRSRSRSPGKQQQQQQKK